MLKIASIMGARPQFIKAAPVSKAISKYHKIKEIIIHTGQHYDYNMNDIFFQELGLRRPDYNLNVGSHSQVKQIALILERIEKVLSRERPHLVLVYGDTNSTLAAALAARKLNILTAHIEAGLRSYNMSIPEEVNRVITDRISDILFCPSQTAARNLSLEGIVNSGRASFPKVFIVGDVMYDAILFYIDVAKSHSDILNKLSLVPQGYYLATVHRQENTDNPERLKRILESLECIARDSAPVIFPVHPRTAKAMRYFKFNSFKDRLKFIPPVSYLDMLMLTKNALVILTDSGGLQKEAYLLDVPCVTLRRETEWVETLDDGANVLADADKNKIKKAINKIRPKFNHRRNVYGDGRAAEKIAKIIREGYQKWIKRKN